MDKYLTCNQVASLINYYISGELNPTLEEYVNLHIKNCKKCRSKILSLKNELNKYNNIKKDEVKINTNYEFQNSLSAYVDKELNYNDNIKIKKYTISNNKARKELETMYKFQKLLHSAYEQTKKNSKKDYSKAILSEIINESYYMNGYFKKLIFVFGVILAVIVTGFIYLYF